jgi:preprotein translocase subunit YajC
MKNLKKLFLTLSVFAFSGSLFADEVQEVVPAKQGNYMQTLIMIVIALVFFYFILWRPEQKRRKKSQTLRESMKKGDKVTAMGIIGIVSQVKDNTVILKMVDGAKVEFLKAAITDVQSTPDEQNEEAPTNN